MRSEIFSLNQKEKASKTSNNEKDNNIKKMGGQILIKLKIVLNETLAFVILISFLRASN